MSSSCHHLPYQQAGRESGDAHLGRDTPHVDRTGGPGRQQLQAAGGRGEEERPRPPVGRHDGAPHSVQGRQWGGGEHPREGSQSDHLRGDDPLQAPGRHQCQARPDGGSDELKLTLSPPTSDQKYEHSGCFFIILI